MPIAPVTTGAIPPPKKYPRNHRLCITRLDALWFRAKFTLKHPPGVR
jgi:hypothetical protein